jgi:anti-anti-sigma factor
LTIDASEVTFLDSTGVGALVMVAVAVRERGGVVTCRASVQMDRLLALCGIGRLLGVPGTIG